MAVCNRKLGRLHTRGDLLHSLKAGSERSGPAVAALRGHQGLGHLLSQASGFRPQGHLRDPLRISDLSSGSEEGRRRRKAPRLWWKVKQGYPEGGQAGRREVRCPDICHQKSWWTLEPSPGEHSCHLAPSRALPERVDRWG